MAVAVGVISVLAAWFYTGGSKPYGYLGLGEVMVFVFFGLVAVIGTTYVQTETWELAALYAAIGIGALACAILVVNNLRDIPTDTVAGKRTLAVVLGDRRTRLLYLGLVVVAAAAVGATAADTTWWVLAGLVFLVPAMRGVRPCSVEPSVPGSSRCCSRPESPSSPGRSAWPLRSSRPADGWALSSWASCPVELGLVSG